MIIALKNVILPKFLSMKNLIKYILVIVILIVAMSYFLGGGLENQVKAELNEIENQVAEDAIRQYEIAKRNGSAMDAYIQAGMVAAAFLQAEDEINYKKWKVIEEEEAKKVGL